MAQLKAWGVGCRGKEYGSARLQDRSPLLNALVTTLQLVGNMQKAVFFFLIRTLKFSVYRLVEFQ